VPPIFSDTLDSQSSHRGELVADICSALRTCPDEEGGGSALQELLRSQGEGSECVDYFALKLTKIFHGIASPCVSSTFWRSNTLWTKWRFIKFEEVYGYVLEVLGNKSFH